MAMMNTSAERVDALVNLSDALYTTIDQPINGETRARRMLRLGIAAAAHGFQNGTVRYAGDYTHRFLIGELAAGGLQTNNPLYDSFGNYHKTTEELPRMTQAPQIDSPLDTLAVRYANVQRATVTHDGKMETNATHAIHLAHLAMPYASEYYPELEQSKIMLYGIIHDIIEAYTGDVPSIGASDETMHKKHMAEIAALEQLRSEFGENHPEFVNLVINYEKRADDEARFIKSFDKLDPGFTHLYSNGKQLIEMHGIHSADQFMETIEATSRRVSVYGSDFPDLLRDLHEMHERVAATVDWPQRTASLN